MPSCRFDLLALRARRSRLPFSLCLIVFLLSGIAPTPALFGQEVSGAATASGLPPAAIEAPQTPATNVKPASLADLAWLQGHWSGDWGPRTATQIWTEPRGGMMLGTLQIVENNKTIDVEFFLIRQTARGVEYRVLHFTSSLKPWAPATFFLSSTDSRQFVFRNQSDGAPQQFTLTRSDPDTYTSNWEISRQAGDTLNWEITFHRQKTPNGGSGGRR